MSPEEIAIQLKEGLEEITSFRNKEIRKVFHNNEWFFSLTDVVYILTDSKDPKQYIKDMRSRDEGLQNNWGEIVTPLELDSPDGKKRETNCVNIQGILRIIQSIKSPKAEPFKHWLAKVGFERLQEIQDPQIAIKRAMFMYHLKGYPNEWIKTRIVNIVTRKELEGEWHKRGINKGVEFAVLTDAISSETFGITTSKHKAIKSLAKHHSLRDNMTDLELLFMSLAEKSTVQFARKNNAQGFYQNEYAAKAGGRIAGSARKNLEKELGESVISRDNYLTEKQKDNVPKLPASIDEAMKSLFGEPTT